MQNVTSIQPGACVVQTFHAVSLSCLRIIIKYHNVLGITNIKNHIRIWVRRPSPNAGYRYGTSVFVLVTSIWKDNMHCPIVCVTSVD